MGAIPRSLQSEQAKSSQDPDRSDKLRFTFLKVCQPWRGWGAGWSMTVKLCWFAGESWGEGGCLGLRDSRTESPPVFLTVRVTSGGSLGRELTFSEHL